MYWLGDLKEDVEKTISKWGRYIREQLCEPSLPKTEFHCTMKYDESKNPDFEKRWLKDTKGLKIPMISQSIIIGPKGVALQIDRERFIDDWFAVPNSVPHVTLYVNKDCLSKDLGPMMKQAEKSKWEATENPLIFQIADKEYLKILCATPMIGVPRMVINTRVEPKVKEHQTKQTELLKDMERQVPLELWSQHDTDVGLVKSANPIKVVLKPGAKVPRKLQYPLKPEAVEGIKKTIEGLMKAGVLVETTSYCNTPILPVTKADKSKWRLVHDLRAVNEVVEDWPAEVPNPHTLLTNVPSVANYYTVVDLCSAFFSVPLAEESRPLFAFTYQGKKLTYTRMPQGFKHSPHVYNQILKEELEELRLDSTLIQYVNDLLICSTSLEQCHQDSIKVLNKLAEGGHKASKAKLQYCLPQVEYLGRTISHGMKAVSPSQLEGISKVPQPQTVGQMMTFLGMTGFSADWIEDYAIKTAPLRALMKQVGCQNLRAPLVWNTE
uniref:ribonuclease H n=1 Tax=Sinocyclocheilus grahami TaxID=75366 RepID=A0A672MX06_SINGR